MSFRDRFQLNTPVRPLQPALTASVVAYLLTAVLAHNLSPPEVASPLVSIPALVIAHMLVVAAYTALLVAASPRIDLDKGAIRAAESRAALFQR